MEGEIISHSETCGVNTTSWSECVCGLQNRMTESGREKFLNHANDCPCHCSCDFAERLMDYLTYRRLHHGF